MILNISRLRTQRVAKGLTKTAGAIIKEAAHAPLDMRWDVFLSYSSHDKDALPDVIERLQQEGLSVYIDKLADADLTPDNVTTDTAHRLRQRLHNSEALFVLTSQNTSRSRWVPWELGFADGGGKRVAVLPIDYQPEAETRRFVGTEYLGLYPWIDEVNDNRGQLRLWSTHPDDPSVYRELTTWLAGSELVPH